MTKLLILLFLSNNIFALAQTIEVRADEVLINQKTNISKYSGSVSFIQGEMQLLADIVEIKKNISKNAKPEYTINAKQQSKNQVKFIHATNAIQAKANSLVYNTTEGIVHLFGNAELMQNQDFFIGEKIIYDIKQDKISIKGKKNKQTKIKINL